MGLSTEFNELQKWKLADNHPTRIVNGGQMGGLREAHQYNSVQGLLDTFPFYRQLTLQGVMSKFFKR